MSKFIIFKEFVINSVIIEKEITYHNEYVIPLQSSFAFIVEFVSINWAYCNQLPRQSIRHGEGVGIKRAEQLH